MWIYTQNGDLLNADRMDSISYDDSSDCTFARSDYTNYIVGQGDLTVKIKEYGLKANPRVLEVK